MVDRSSDDDDEHYNNNNNHDDDNNNNEDGDSNDVEPIELFLVPTSAPRLV